MTNDRDDSPARKSTRGLNPTDPDETIEPTAVQPKSFLPQQPGTQPSNAWNQLEKIGRGDSAADVDEEKLYQLARATMKARRLRNRFLPSAMFGEPAWNMLLALYIVDRRGARETISQLCLSSGSPASTALRWLDYLEQQKLVARRQSSTDRRVVFIDLTDLGRQAVEIYFTQISRDLLTESLATS